MVLQRTALGGCTLYYAAASGRPEVTTPLPILATHRSDQEQEQHKGSCVPFTRPGVRSIKKEHRLKTPRGGSGTQLLLITTHAS